MKRRSTVIDLALLLVILIGCTSTGTPSPDIPPQTPTEPAATDVPATTTPAQAENAGPWEVVQVTKIELIQSL